MFGVYVIIIIEPMYTSNQAMTTIPHTCPKSGPDQTGKIDSALLGRNTRSALVRKRGDEAGAGGKGSTKGSPQDTDILIRASPGSPGCFGRYSRPIQAWCYAAVLPWKRTCAQHLLNSSPVLGIDDGRKRAKSTGLLSWASGGGLTCQQPAHRKTQKIGRSCQAAMTRRSGDTRQPTPDGPMDLFFSAADRNKKWQPLITPTSVSMWHAILWMVKSGLQTAEGHHTESNPGKEGNLRSGLDQVRDRLNRGGGK